MSCLRPPEAGSAPLCAGDMRGQNPTGVYAVSLLLLVWCVRVQLCRSRMNPYLAKTWRCLGAREKGGGERLRFLLVAERLGRKVAQGAWREMNPQGWESKRCKVNESKQTQSPLDQ